MDKKIGKWTFSEEAVAHSLKAATKRGQEFLATTPRAVEAFFDEEKQLITVYLNNGCVFGFPPRYLKELRTATDAEISQITVTPQGTALHWEHLDAHYRLIGLLNGIFGTKAWLAELGRKGGSVTTDAKAKAARINGAKGGRPRKTANDNTI